MVKFRQSPIDQTQLELSSAADQDRRRAHADLLLVVVYHHIMRLDVSVHDSFRMAEIERFEEFKDVETDVKVGKFGIKRLELGVLSHQR
jgi:hypothetical protein